MNVFFEWRVLIQIYHIRTHNVQKNENNKNLVQKIYEYKEQTYNYAIHLILLAYDMKMKELSKPENFKLLNQIKLLRKRFMCIELKTYLLLALCIKFFANNFRPWREVCFVVKKKEQNVLVLRYIILIANYIVHFSLLIILNDRERYTLLYKNFISKLLTFLKSQWLILLCEEFVRFLTKINVFQQKSKYILYRICRKIT